MIDAAPPHRLRGSLFFRGLFTACLLTTIAGCSGPTATPGEESKSESESPVDLDSLQTKIEAVAKTRVDGDGQIVEVDLRGQNDVTILDQLAQLPKLRSVLLSDSGVTDDDMESVGRIKSLENLDLRGCSVSDIGLQPLSQLTRLKAIKLSGKDDKTRVTDQGMYALSSIGSLKVVALDFLPISDRGVETLLELNQLRELYLAGTAITNQSASALTRFPELAKLRVASTQFGDAGLGEMLALSTLDPLTELDVSDCPGITNASIELIAGLKNLAKLNLYNTSIGDASWGQLSELEKLTWLNVDKTDVSDASLGGIGKLTPLKFLHLGSTQITDAGLDKLASLDNLETLILTRTEVTAAGVDSLKSALPETKIQLEYVAPE